MKIIIFLFFFISISIQSFCQTEPLIQNATVTIDSLNYSIQKNTILLNGLNHLYFFVDRENPTLTLTISTASSIQGIRLTDAPDYEIIDTLKELSHSVFKAKIKLNDILKGQNAVTFKIKGKNGNDSIYRLPLFPIARPDFTLNNFDKTLFQGEQKIIEIPVENGFNIKEENAFVLGKDFDYKMSVILNFLEITIKPHFVGSKTISIPVSTILPVVDDQNKITNGINPLKINVNVKTFRLTYINFDKKTVFFNAEAKGKEQIMIDYNPFLEPNQKYKIEDEEGGNGNLIGELFVQSYLENSKKLLCIIKPLALHKMSDGYLFIKDGEKNRFICNLNIVEKP
jgi:hypothetical protein